jgi:acetyl-CoA carboxylase biotin carboxyl carrier protein
VDLKQIKELMAAMEKTDITRIRIKDKDKYEIELERQNKAPAHPPAPIHSSHPELHPKLPGHTTIPHRGHHEEIPKEPIVDGRFIIAPLVGTVYHSPSPEDPSFVKVGDKIDENTVVCIIEAMKVMNEVKSGINGTVAEILVSNGHPVEFGAKIIRVV